MSYKWLSKEDIPEMVGYKAVLKLQNHYFGLFTREPFKKKEWNVGKFIKRYAQLKVSKKLAKIWGDILWRGHTDEVDLAFEGGYGIFKTPEFARSYYERWKMDEQFNCVIIKVKIKNVYLSGTTENLNFWIGREAKFIKEIQE